MSKGFEYAKKITYPVTVRPGSKQSMKSNNSLVKPQKDVDSPDNDQSESPGKRRNFRGKHKSLAVSKNDLKKQESYESP